MYGLHSIHHRMTEMQFAILQMQYAAPNHTVTAPQLAAAVGLKSFYPINLHYGKLGRLLAEQINLSKRVKSPRTGNLGWYRILSSGEWGKDGFQWVMYPELAKALEEIGIVEKDCETYLPEEVGVRESLIEGAVRKITVNAFERNFEARRQCIAYYGTRCSICSFDFGEKYGQSFEGFIHVHHLRPLSELGGAYQVDPIADLRPVCPNCHAIIHSQKPPLSIEEMKTILRMQKAV